MASSYVLGHSPTELQRLAMQSQLFGEVTLEVLTRAGIARGMRVLDLGTGAGDVAMLVATLVGESGSVLGVDRASASVETATERARAAGLANLTFKTSSIDDLDVEGRFDAVVGRLVLMYLQDPSAALARIRQRFLEPGAIVAFLEFDIDASRQVPPVALVEETLTRICDTLRHVGNSTSLGTRLPQVYRAAGLPEPQLLGRVILQAAPAVECTRHIAAVARSILPHMEKFGVASGDEVQIDTLADRMQQALVAADATLLMPTLIGAWTRLPD